MEKEKLKEESLEEQVEELRKEVFKVFELLLPPKEVREEVLKNLYTAQLSLLKVIKTIVDYEVEKLEKKISKQGMAKKRVQKVEVE